MARIILTRGGADILGSDGLLHVDGRKSLSSVKQQVRERNRTFEKNFPDKVADGFYLAGERLKRISPNITMKRIVLIAAMAALTSSCASVGGFRNPGNPFRYEQLCNQSPEKDGACPAILATGLRDASDDRTCSEN